MADLLEAVRASELEGLRQWFKPGSRVVEIGGGSGYQASLLAKWGCSVRSLDLAERRPWPHTYFTVESYDGEHLPVADGAADIVFSSNVLQDVPPAKLPAFIDEMRRVLAPGGLAVHVLPSSSWRLSTNATYYAYLAKRLAGIEHRMPGATEVADGSTVAQRRGVAYLLRRLILPPPVGAYPSALAEVFYFRRARWTALFRDRGFEVVSAEGNGLFYTGVGLWPELSIDARRQLAQVLGSACTNLVLRAP